MWCDAPSRQLACGTGRLEKRWPDHNDERRRYYLSVGLHSRKRATDKNDPESMTAEQSGRAPPDKKLVSTAARPSTWPSDPPEY
ncbi:hypothetical protein QR680_011974 [Steinernema hermaphroditum]|uniref:Uncharacterized protein n=1 Tax=Steinernema hermaphroditum TaxID=289476 RepID=A0AA39I2X2_9BILA|nr:hypothetical protein QR680_011974 [Steinernema hermaphroditum]